MMFDIIVKLFFVNNYIIWVLNSILSVTIIMDLTYLGITYGNLFQGIITILVAFLVAWFGIEKFYLQKRSERIQKIYFDNGLLKQLNDLETLINLSTENIHILVQIKDLIYNFEAVEIEEGILKEKFDNLIHDIKMVNHHPVIAKTVINELFGKYYGERIVQWIDKIEKDSSRFNALVLGYSIKATTIFLKNNSENSKDKIIKFLNQTQAFHNLTIGRAYVFLELFPAVIRRLSTRDFKSRDNLIEICRKELDEDLRKIDEAFKWLYGFYQDQNTSNIFYSHAKDEKNNHYKLTFIKQSGIYEEYIIEEIAMVKFPNDLEEENPCIVYDDFVLVENKEKSYPMKQLIFCTFNHIWEDKPKQLPKILSFSQWIDDTEKQNDRSTPTCLNQ